MRVKRITWIRSDCALEELGGRILPIEVEQSGPGLKSGQISAAGWKPGAPGWASGQLRKYACGETWPLMPKSCFQPKI